MLVVNGQLIAVSKRVPGHVVGDGTRTIDELVDEVNRDPRRGIGHEKVLTRIDFDHQAERLLAGARPDEGLGAARRAGGLPPLHRRTSPPAAPPTDVTDIVHPDNVEMAVRAIRAIGLDVGGVDFLSPDITESYKDIGGAICEVNAAPGLPDAHGAERGQAAGRGGTGDRHAVPAGQPEQDPDRRDDRHQRQDDDGAHAGAHP